ncbi:hypothetical protein GNF18_09820 [Ligilactobacillus pobuzihii]|uniref:CatB-related O-acetyltransferase n=1 Tax=Ligilactobacillus pobuzihii TaxID=449659 RepID=UPI001EB49A25|nr:CatB-related O-acetyltransferase [Ligilactobacillus pobuzihii]MBN7275437.1 hypothetical protein [Ligilactobacillus pobuzihii]
MKDTGFLRFEKNIFQFIDKNGFIKKILVKNFEGIDTQEIISKRDGKYIFVDLSSIPELPYGNYGFFYQSSSGKVLPLPVLNDNLKEQVSINKNEFDKFIVYQTKGRNLSLKVRTSYEEEEVDTTPELVDFFSQNKIYFDQKTKNDKLAKKYKFQKDVRIEEYTQLVRTHGKLFSVGMGTYVNDVQFPLNTRIGRYCSIAPGVEVMGGGRHPQNRFTTSPITLSNPSEQGISPAIQDRSYNQGFIPTYFKQRKLPIIIGNDVWIGNNVVIKSGVTIGDGAILAQGAIITKDVPPYALVAGVPATVKRYRFSPEIIAKLQELKWWNYAYWEFSGVYGGDSIEVFIDKFEDLLSHQEIKPYAPRVVTGEDLLKFKTGGE